MSNLTEQQPTESRDANHWAQPVTKLRVSSHVPPGALNVNVNGRHVAGALQGFGQMWQKTYRIRLSGAKVTPGQVVKAWKENFGAFWPKGNRFYGPMTGIAPGEVAVLNLAGPGNITGPGDTPLIATGVMVIYADDESFTFMTPEGHIVAGWITFSAYEEDGATVAQAQVLIRPSDPLYELTFRFGLGHKTEDDFWNHTVRAVAAHFGVKAEPRQQTTLVDPKIQWSQWKNIWRNSAIRTGLYMLAAPVRWVGHRLRSRRSTA